MNDLKQEPSLRNRRRHAYSSVRFTAILLAIGFASSSKASSGTRLVLTDHARRLSHTDPCVEILARAALSAAQLEWRDLGVDAPDIFQVNDVVWLENDNVQVLSANGSDFVVPQSLCQPSSAKRHTCLVENHSREY